MPLFSQEKNPLSQPIESETDADESGQMPQLRAKSVRQWLIGLAIVGMGIAVFHRPIGEAIHRQVARYFASDASKYMALQNAQAAMMSVEKALEWMPDDPALVYLRAQVHAENEDWNASLADYARITDDLAPEFASAYVKRAVVHEQRARYDDALADLEQAYKLSPSDTPALLNHCAYVRALAGGDLDKAMEEIDRAATLYEEKVAAAELQLQTPAAFVDTRGFILFRAGRAEEALPVIDRALELLVDERKKILSLLAKRDASTGVVMQEYDLMQGEIVFHRAQINESLNRPEAAAQDFQLASELGYKPVTRADNQPED